MCVSLHYANFYERIMAYSNSSALQTKSMSLVVLKCYVEMYYRVNWIIWTNPRHKSFFPFCKIKWNVASKTIIPLRHSTGFNYVLFFLFIFHLSINQIEISDDKTCGELLSSPAACRTCLELCRFTPQGGVVRIVDIRIFSGLLATTSLYIETKEEDGKC